MTRDDVMKEFGADEVVRMLPIAVAYPVKSIAEEVATLRDRLAAVEAERDALQQQVVQWWGKDASALLRAERILAALREPSEAVVRAGIEHYWDLMLSDPVDMDDVRESIRAAVEAAEKEVSGE